MDLANQTPRELLGSFKPRPVRRRAATAMGPGGRVARRLGALLWRWALPPRAGSAAGDGSRLPLLAAGRLPAGRAPSESFWRPRRARGLHGGPGLEERAEGAAGEGRPDLGTAGTDVEGVAAAPCVQPGFGPRPKRLCMSFGVTQNSDRPIQSARGASQVRSQETEIL